MMSLEEMNMGSEFRNDENPLKGAQGSGGVFREKNYQRRKVAGRQTAIGKERLKRRGNKGGKRYQL